MVLPFTFANVSTLATPALDANYAALGALTPIPCTVAGTNLLTLTPQASTPTVASYSNYMQFTGIAIHSNTSSVSAVVNTAGVLPVYKDTSGGPVVLTGGEIVATCAFGLLYDLALNSGNGGFHLIIPGTSGGSGAVPGGDNTDVQFNDNGAFGGNSGFTYSIFNSLTVAMGTFNDTAGGGTIELTAGAGGDTSGGGGAVSILAGSASGGGNGGQLHLASGDGVGTGGSGGDVFLTSGQAGVTTTGGTININAGIGGSTSGNGGEVFITAGDTGDGGAGDGGQVFIDAGSARGVGTGGAASLTSGDGGLTSGAGGPLTVESGRGRSGNSAGGLLSILAGPSSGTTTGGAVSIKGGNGSTAAAGGPIGITAGDGGATSGTGGAVNIAGGAATGTNSSGGNIVMTGGAKTGSGIIGHILITGVENCANDAAASVAGVPVTGIYRTGSALMIRVT